MPSVSPRSLVKYLDTYVVGQTKAKKVLAVGVWNHYLRVASNQRMREEHEQRLADAQPDATPASRSLRLGKFQRDDTPAEGDEVGESWKAHHAIQQERAAERSRDPHGEATRSLMFGRAEREWLVNAGRPQAIEENRETVRKFGDTPDAPPRRAVKTPAEEAEQRLGQGGSETALAEAASRMHDAVLSDYTPAAKRTSPAEVSEEEAPLYFSSNSIAHRPPNKPAPRTRTAKPEADVHKWESPSDRAAHAASLAEERTRRALRAAHQRLSTPTPSAPSATTASTGMGMGSFMSSQPGTLPFFEKSNILLLGPSGSGKTLLLRTLAQALDVPFVHVDATPLTMAGYVGDDVESIIQRLLVESGWDVERAQRGIVCIDEIDKLRRGPVGGGAGGKDVGGEGVQQALLRMLEGTTIQVADKSGAAAAGGGKAKPQAWSPLNPGEGGKELGAWYNSRRQRVGGRDPAGGVQGQGASFSVDTSSILFVLSGAFVGIEETIRKRLASHGGALGTAELLARLEPGDLEQYGLIPEFIGRVPVSVVLAPLTHNDLVRVMTEPRNSLVDQYTSLFQLNGITLHMTRGAIEEVVHRALGTSPPSPASTASTASTSKKKEKVEVGVGEKVERVAGGGARSLRRIMEEILLDAFYESYGSESVKYILVDRAAVRDGHVKLFSRGQKFDFDAQCGLDSEPPATIKPPVRKEKHEVDPTRVSMARLKARAMVRARLRRTNRLVDPVIYI